ncbi:hypothetical protein [Dokdonella sp.]|uniref:hypothetical protein n=1 Tax=Dokdonella sp. TaxID=2291710 RepID=UPI0035283868
MRTLMRLRNVVLVTVVLLAGSGLALEFAARSAAKRLVQALEPTASLSYESAGIALDGSIRFDSPRLELSRGVWLGGLRARVANLRGPGRFWLIGQALTGDPVWPSGMTLTTRGLGIEESGEPGISNWVSLPELVLFENLGCGSDALTSKDRLRMGLTPTERVDTFGYRYDEPSRQLELSMSLNSEDVARWTGSAEFTAFDPARWAESAVQQELRLGRASLSYQDPGYLSRRNKFCAEWLGITPAQFVDRHVAAVRTFLATRGIDPSEDVLGLYQRMVSRSGSLNLASLPDASWVPVETDAYPRQVLLRLLNITVRIDDAPPIMLRLAFTDPEQPLYVVTSDLPDPAMADALAVEMPEQDAEPASAEAAVESIDEASPGKSEDSVAAQAQVSEPDTAEAAANEVASAAPESGTVDVAPEAPTSSPGLGASAPPPPEDSTLALVWKPGQIERLPPPKPKARDYDVVAVSSLGGLVGRKVQLLTAGGKQVDGDVLKVQSADLVLLVQVGRGSAELNVPLANIREVRLMRQRPAEPR